MQYLNIIYNPTFQFIIATIIAFILYFRQRQKKELSYKIISVSPLLTSKNPLAQKLEVFYDGKQIINPHLLVLRIANTGNVPIKSEDFERPVNLIFDAETQVFSAEISNKTPSNLEVELEFIKSTVIIKPTLLNKYDSFTIAMLTNAKENFYFDARIAGIKELKTWKGGFTQRIILPAFVLFFLLLVSFAFVTAIITDPMNVLRVLGEPVGVSASLILIMLLITKFKERFKHPMD